jgi:hypothetical protein
MKQGTQFQHRFALAFGQHLRWYLLVHIPFGQPGCWSRLDLNFRAPSSTSPLRRMVSIVPATNGVAF